MKNDKTLYIIAGADGSGKTTFALNFAELEDLYFINTDEIAKEYNSEDIQKHKIKAGRVFFARLNSKLQGDKSFAIETTLSGKYIIRVIRHARKSGFKIILIYLYLEKIQENVLRVKNRVLSGGHNVPEKDIIRRYYRSRKLFLHPYKTLVDKWLLFYNGDDKFELVANNKAILDEILYNNFLEEIN